jgi:hypothetical protein
MSFSDGVLSAVIWPTHAGMIRVDGTEPLGSPDYARGQIRWDVMPNGEIVGRVRVYVCAGQWAWIAYCAHPCRPQIITAQKLAHTLELQAPGMIDLDCITEKDVRPLAFDPILRD